MQNAVPEVREVATYVTNKAGGDGAVREFAEALLKAQGRWDEMVQGYLSARGESPGDTTDE